MIKRILGAVSALALTVGTLPVVYAGYNDVAASSAEYDAVTFLSDMGIFSGYSDGSFKPEKTLSRAEFAKLIVMILDKETEAGFNSLTAGFSDVPQGAWYVGYVNYISDQGIIKGYADGSFAPNKAITYAEAITILCRLMGYTESSVGYYWPQNYMNQASKLGITSGLAIDSDTAVTRGVAAILIERILFSDISKEASEKSMKLIEYLGYTLYENSYVIATKSESSALTSKQVKTVSGVYETADGVTMPKAGEGGTVVINKDGKLAGIRKDAFASLTVYVTSMPDSNTIEYRTASGTTGSYTFDSSFETYVNYSKLAYSQSSSQIGVDTEITFCGDEYGEWDFAVIDNNTESNTAVLASKDYTDSDTYIGSTAINKNNLQIYRNGEAAKLSDIKKNDVIYYNTKTNVIDVYSKKVSGIYAEAYPSKAYVTSVKVAGKTYTLSGTGAAKQSLDASAGSFAIGERVTLLLGKDDRVEFAVELSDFNYFDYGVLLDCKNEVSEDAYDEGTSRIVAEIYMPDGNTHTYTVSKDYSSSLKGKLVHLSYNGSVVSLSAVEGSSLSGSLDVSNRKFAGRTVSKDVKVIHRISSENAQTVSVEMLDFDTLGVSKLDSNQVINVVSANAFGDIGIIYLEKLASGYDYGYLIGSKSVGADDNSSYQYTIFANGEKTVYSNSARYSVTSGTPVMFKTENGTIKEIYSLKSIASAADYDAYESGRILIKGSVYYVDDDTQVVYIENSTSGKYKTVSVSDLPELNIKSIALYAKKDEGTDSNIKVIVVR